MSKVINGICADIRHNADLLMIRIRRVGIKRVILNCIPYLIAGYVVNKAFCLYRNTSGNSKAHEYDSRIR